MKLPNEQTVNRIQLERAQIMVRKKGPRQHMLLVQCVTV